MNIKDKIQQEAEKRYEARGMSGIHFTERRSFIAGAEWLYSEIVQPLIKENEGLNKALSQSIETGEKAIEKIGELESRLSLSQGERERIVKLFETFYREMALEGSVLSDSQIDTSWDKFKIRNNL